ncbi:MAG: C45 family autoproteolytic acyltransferase/hydrolase [Pirellulales bacterium]
MNRISLACMAYLVASLLFARATIADHDIIKLSGQPQLFLDDHLVATSTNLERRVEQPAKHPDNPVMVQDLPWEKRLIATYGTVLYDEESGKFRCWYTAGEHKDGIPDTPDGTVTAEYFICYAESDDGIHWQKPLVSQEKFGLHDQHNIVIPTGHGFCVLPSPDASDPNKRYLGVGGAIFGFSPDGISWDTKNWRDAVGKNDTSSCVIRWNDEYLAYVRYQVKDPAWPGVMRGVGLCSSSDFEHWTPKELILTTDEKDGYPWTQPYGIAVTPYGDQLIGILSLLHLDRIEGNNSLGDEDTQLIVSRDGRNWSRVGQRTPFLAPSPGTWDQGRIHAPATSMLVKDDVVYIYYSASDNRHGSGSWGVAGIGLATLPADRFVALQREDSDAGGVLETRLLEVSGNSLLVNASAEETDLQVELLDDAGQVIPGFDRDSSRLITHDKLRFRVVWERDGKQHTLGDAAKNQPLALRFVLGDGALYAFQIAKDSPDAAPTREVSLKGTPYERGLQQGQHFATEIQSNISHFKHDLSKPAVAAAVEQTRSLLEQKFPEINEELRGIAEGAQVPFRDVFLFNNRAIVGQVDRDDCSNVAVHHGDTVILGMNKDRPVPLPPYDKYFLKKVYPEDGYAFIGYGHVGRIWGHGMNEHGLCTAGTAAYPQNDESEVPSIGSYFVPPLLLSKCKNVPEALELLEEIEPICDSGNFMLCDASGEMVVIEITAQQRVVRKASSGRLTATTFFASGENEHRNDPTKLQESQHRYETIQHCLDETGEVTLADMQSILRSHKDDGPVCLHDRAGNSTVLSWIALPASREFYFCDSPPCQGTYKLHKLHDEPLPAAGSDETANR